MIKFLKIFGFGKNIKQVVKPAQTAAFAKYHTALPSLTSLTSKKADTIPLIYGYKTQIPAQYTTPEFRSYMSMAMLKRKNIRNTRAEQFTKNLFDSHQKAVSKIMHMDRRFHKETDYDKYIQQLTNPDMCLKLLDYDTRNKVFETKIYLDRGNTNNILLNQIAKGGMSPERASALLERFDGFSRNESIFVPAETLKEKWYFYPKEITELVNAIMRTGDEKQLCKFAKTLENCALDLNNTKESLCEYAIHGVAKAAHDISIPKEFIKPAKILIKAGGDIPEYASEVLSHIEGTFDIIAEFMKRKNTYPPAFNRMERAVSAGFRSAVKDGRLDEYKKIVLNPKNEFLSYLINDYSKTRTPAEDELFKKEITSKLLNKEFQPFLDVNQKSSLERIFGSADK